MPATCSPASRASRRRPATSPAVCRASPSCSRRASPRISRSSAEIDGRVEFGKDYKTKRRILVVPREGRAGRVSDPARASTSRCRKATIVRKGDLLMDGNPVPHDILTRARRRGAGELPHQRDPGGLSAAGREDQRQAHRGDRPPDAAEGGDRRRRATPSCWPASRWTAKEFDVENQKAVRESGRPAIGNSGAAGHHQGKPADALVHLGGLVPGDDPRAHRGRRSPAGSTRCSGLKENVIVGRLIPAGTGAVMARLREIAAHRDRELGAPANEGAEPVAEGELPAAE